MKIFLSIVEYVSIIGFAGLIAVIVKRTGILSKVEMSFFGLFFGYIIGMILWRLGREE